MIIAIFHNATKQQAREVALKICDYLKRQSVVVVAEAEEAHLIGADPLSHVKEDEVDFCITLGGDGTILRLVHHHPKLHAPILAVNAGSLGFMADIPVDDVFTSLECLLAKRYRVQERLVIEGKTEKNESAFAVNEIVIHRAPNPCLIDLAIYVDGRYLNTFSADGIIIATPSGSTAYSLAAGGPILTPELNALVLTPISPHAISNRPIVLFPHQDIRVEYISSHVPVEVIYDGFPYFSLSHSEALSVVISQRRFRLVMMPEHDYYATLRSKLGWTGKLR